MARSSFHFHQLGSQYETQVTKSLAAIFEPKFPKLPAEVIPTIVAFWAHVGDY